MTNKRTPHQSEGRYDVQAVATALYHAGKGQTMVIDNYRLWEIHQREEDEWLAGRPVCDGCGEAIQTESYYEDEGDRFCERCWDDHVKEYFLRYVEV